MSSNRLEKSIEVQLCKPRDARFLCCLAHKDFIALLCCNKSDGKDPSPRTSRIHPALLASHEILTKIKITASHHRGRKGDTALSKPNSRVATWRKQTLCFKISSLSSALARSRLTRWHRSYHVAFRRAVAVDEAVAQLG